MRRREFITLLSGAAAWVSPARAQEPRRVIGSLGSGSSDTWARAVTAFVQGLKDTGFIEGNNISIEWRWAADQYSRLPSLAGELVSRRVAVIACFDTPSAFAAKAATGTIPIVFGTGADPVKIGLVDSFNQPGGNLTGISNLISGLGPKRFELLHELIPNASTIAVLVNPDNPNAPAYAPETQAAADALRVHLEVLTASSEDDLEMAFTIIAQRRAEALVVMADPIFLSRGQQLVVLAARHAVPAIFPIRMYAELGGLVSYGTDYIEEYQKMGTYTGKILKGAKPIDLPVQQSTKLELVINLKTAKALGLTVPDKLLAIADEVIE
jgi:putative tryptophan/tyrosine transport system substrate-binding protein